MVGPRDVRPFPPGCPWSGWALPDIRHCEENLCGWIAAPSDTWSNLAYLAAAAWLWRSAAREPGAVRWFPHVAVAIGLTSFAFHASFTAAFQFLDYVGMFLLAGLLGAVGLERGGWTRAGAGGRSLLALTAAGVAAFGAARALGLPVQPIIGLEALALLGLELGLARGSGGVDYKPLWAALALVGGGLACWLLDYTRVWCDPADHFVQGHAAWHLLTAAALIPAFRFYRQFGRAAAPERPFPGR